MTQEESDAAWDQFFREEYPEISDKLHREIDEWIDELTRDWPPPDSPAQLAVFRRVFGGPRPEDQTSQDPAAGQLRQDSPAAGRHTSSKGHAA